MPTIRFLIMNDDTHEDMYCFGNGQRYCLEELLEVLTPASNVNYEYTTAYITDIQEAFCQAYPNTDADYAEHYVNNLFDTIMHINDIDYTAYCDAFNEVWELASNL